MRLCRKTLGVVLLALALLVVLGVSITVHLGNRGVPDLPPGRVDYNCSDFQTWEEAKLVFDAYAGDPFRLDGDGDGIPCEALLE